MQSSIGPFPAAPTRRSTSPALKEGVVLAEGTQDSGTIVQKFGLKGRCDPRNFKRATPLSARVTFWVRLSDPSTKGTRTVTPRLTVSSRESLVSPPINSEEVLI